MNSPPSFWRLVLQWLCGVLLAIVLTALFIAAAFAQLTSREPAERVHRRAIATLTDIDARLPAIEDALKTESARPQTGPLQVPDFPIPVQLTVDEARDLRGAALRDRILRDAAATLYDDGMSQWAAAEGRTQSIDDVSTPGAIKTGFGLARDSTHGLFLAGAIALAALAAALALGLLFAVRDWNLRLVALGTTVLAAALPCLAAVIAVRFGFKTAQTGADPFVQALLDIGIDAMSVPIRDYLVLSALGFGVAGLGAFGSWLQTRGPRRLAPALPPGE